MQSGIDDVGGGTLDATKRVCCTHWGTYQTIYTQGYLALNNAAPTLT